MLVAVVEILTVDDEDFFGGNGAALEQADLLGFFVFDTRFAAEGVKVIFAKTFLLELCGRSSFGHDAHFVHRSVARVHW